MTTSTTHLQAKRSPHSSTPAPKRRRRSAAPGAAEDCHSCRKTQTQCDRRRPYCSQCLAIGKDCSGYRTNLTWGVGVASRGKLRGLSLPIADDQSHKNLKSQDFRLNASQTPSNHPPSRRKEQQSMSRKNLEDSQRLSLAQIHNESLCNMPVPCHTGNWSSGLADQQIRPSELHSSYHEPQCDFLSYSSNYEYCSLPPATNINVSINSDTVTHDEERFHGQNNSNFYIDESLRPWNLKSELANPSANGSIIPASSISSTSMYYEASSAGSSMGSLPLEAGFDEMTDEALSIEDVSSPVDGRYTTARINEESNNNTANTRFGEYVQPFPAESNLHLVHIEKPKAQDEMRWWTPDPGRSLSVSSAPLQVKALLDFYDKAICPVLVAFDGPTNPYRKYVMPLALHDKGLQSALAALATNNLRMRRLKEIPCLRGAPASVSLRISDMIGKPSAEEQLHKSNSIEHLNLALTKNGAAQEDSVLATLLILCLFHVCDSGFSRFKTQLIGVQKLLRMRGVQRQTDFVAWVEMFFAWFDVMTSAVNDRETQIRNDSPMLVDPSHDLGSLEQFSGCEGRLFKLLARLGRLNLLSQGRQVRELPISGVKFEDGEVMHASGDIPWEIPDQRHQFWCEWHDIRARLFSWKLDKAAPNQAHAPNAWQSHHDLLHISESFRFSALLYTERLAYPKLQSSSRNLQDLVLASMHHISHIGMRSCVLKFLLWPLFITGTECVLEEHRDLIRALCGEIQKESGFFNNVSSLKVLEKVWTHGDGAGSGLQAFRWREAMPRVDGEYIVI